MFYWFLFPLLLILALLIAIFVIQRELSRNRGYQSHRPSEPDWDPGLAEEYEFSGELSPLFPEEIQEERPYEPELREWQPPALLPRNYGEDRITLLVRDPNWIFAYWETTGKHVQHCGAQLVMRLYDLTEGSYDEIYLGPEADNWYIEVGRPSHTFRAELGSKSVTGEFIPIAVSNEVSTPSGAPSELIDGEWAYAEELWRRLLGAWSVHPSSLERLEHKHKHVYRGTYRIAPRGGLR